MVCHPVLHFSSLLNTHLYTENCPSPWNRTFHWRPLWCFSFLHESTCLSITTLDLQMVNEWLKHAEQIQRDSTITTMPKRCLTSPVDFWSGVRVAPPGSQSCPWASPWATSFLQLRRGPGDTLLAAATAHSPRGSGGLRQQVSWRGRSGNKNCRKHWTFSMVQNWLLGIGSPSLLAKLGYYLPTALQYIKLTRDAVKPWHP